mgnify:FL=1
MRQTVRQGMAAILFAGSVLLTTMAAMANPAILTPEQAHDKAVSGEILLVDVRSPQEWQQTGVPASAVQQTIHGKGGMPGFAEALLARLSGDKNKPVAVMCATGVRSNYTRKYLEANGFTNVFDVSRGMFGYDSGPGWRESGLPMERWSAK